MKEDLAHASPYLVAGSDWQPVDNPQHRIAVEWINHSGTIRRRYYWTEKEAFNKANEVKEQGLNPTFVIYRVTQMRRAKLVHASERPDDGWWT